MNIQSIYIAAPPDEEEFLVSLKEKFAVYGISVFIGNDLINQLESCYKNDSQVFSSIEQEICSRSDVFLYSPGSSWSLNTAIGNYESSTMSHSLVYSE